MKTRFYLRKLSVDLYTFVKKKKNIAVISIKTILLNFGKHALVGLEYVGFIQNYSKHKACICWPSTHVLRNWYCLVHQSIIASLIITPLLELYWHLYGNIQVILFIKPTTNNNLIDGKFLILLSNVINLLVSFP